MDLLPAIDLRRGRVVRLRQGRDAETTFFDVDPAALLADLGAAGVRRVHLVDLDAAFGEPPQRRLLATLAVLAGRNGRPRLELGGGLGSAEACDWLLAAGFERGVVGSLVARDPARFAALAERYPGRLVPALECAGETVRVAGWTAAAAISPDALADRLRGLPCPALLVTDVERDGMLAGPNVDLAARLARRAGLPAIVSGGVAGLADLRAAAGRPEIGEVIVGRALLEGRFTVAEALAACREAIAEVGAGAGRTRSGASPVVDAGASVGGGLGSLFGTGSIGEYRAGFDAGAVEGLGAGSTGRFGSSPGAGTAVGSAAPPDPTAGEARPKRRTP